MKIEIMRQSGMPVENLPKYLEEWKVIFDKYDNEMVNNKITIEQMQEALNVEDEKLKQNYVVTKDIELPKSGKQWEELQKAVENPILLATREDNHKLVLIIMDQGL